MTDGTAAPLYCLMFVSVFAFVSADQKNITAESGQDVTLPCQTPNNKNILTVEWSRADLEPKYVYVHRDGRFDPENQHTSFKNRVDLQDRQMQDGDVSLILKDVMINDTGTYECRVVQKGTSNKNSDPVCIVTLSVDPPDKKNITAESGQDVTLTCRAPNNNPISVLKWSRADLGDEYLLLYKNKQFETDDQHPSFRNRVDLQDRQMKDGDVSLILKDVTINDTGTYECIVIAGGGGRPKLINSTNLHVVPPGQTGGDTEDGGKEAGSVGLKVGLSVPALLLVAAVVGFLIYRKREKNKESRAVPDSC
ncbi:CD226 antigen-like [Pelmatolapia mariae]|uniref:CD226 antigen-like n=1 Tax=Pelmatolapia mariae TaxID=158779 RepID=UPI002FE531FC